MKRKILISRIAYWLLALVLGLSAGTASSARGWNLPLTIAGVAVLIALIGMAINYYWAKVLTKKIDKLTPILNAQNDPDRFIEKLTDLTAGIKWPALNDVTNIDLAVAYARKEDYDTALYYMDKVDPKRMKGLNQGIYWGDLTLFHYEKGDAETAEALLKDQRSEINAYGGSPNAGPLRDILRVYHALYTGNKADASRLLARAEADWGDRVEAQQDLRILRERLISM